MNLSASGYGQTAFPTVTGVKAITKSEVATQILNEFGTLEKNLSVMSPITGNEVECAKLWAQLSLIRAGFIEAYAGHAGFKGNA